MVANIFCMLLKCEYAVVLTYLKPRSNLDFDMVSSSVVVFHTSVSVVCPRNLKNIDNSLKMYVIENIFSIVIINY